MQQEAHAVIRGIRAISDYDYEQQSALMNRRLAPKVETVFLLSAQEYSYLSSRLVKEVFTYGGNIDGLFRAGCSENESENQVQQGIVNRKQFSVPIVC